MTYLKTLLSAIAAIIIITFSSCGKNDSVPVPDPGIPTPGPDSVSKLNSISSTRNGTVTFSYDATTKLLKSFNRQTADGFDTTFINYTHAGSVTSYLFKYAGVTAGTFWYSAAIFDYNGTNKLLRVYRKKAADTGILPSDYLTNISNKDDILFYDSLAYDAKGRIEYSYKIYDGSTLSTPYRPEYRRFYYNATNDSLLDKAELYDRDANNNFRLNQSLSFLAYDGKKNPAFPSLIEYPLALPVGGQFNLHPTEYGTFLSFYLAAMPQNCTKVNFVSPVAGTNTTTTLNYNYNSLGLPSVINPAGPANEVLTYTYKKYRK